MLVTGERTELPDHDAQCLLDSQVPAFPLVGSHPWGSGTWRCYVFMVYQSIQPNNALSTN